ncbi:MAG: hypothetical protein AABZ55_03390, partial [Bdellovibrionota bacterium]
TGHPSSLTEKPKRVVPGENDAFSSENAVRAKINSEILGEMVRVVLGTGQIPASEFGSLVDSLNQGASFEGVYNGLVRSGRYRKLEVEYPKTTSTVISSFSDELIRVESDLKLLTEFDLSSALPLGYMDPSNPGATDPRIQGMHDFVKPLVLNRKEQDLLGQAKKFQKLFSRSSLFTLKRVLGEEILKIVDEKKQDRLDLAIWYSKWAVRMAAKKVDFGLPLRNSADEKFHFDWAMKASVDQLQWETLNRIHRLLNEAHEKKS